MKEIFFGDYLGGKQQKYQPFLILSCRNLATPTLIPEPPSTNGVGRPV